MRIALLENDEDGTEPYADCALRVWEVRAIS